jgi:Na+-translocating ferredoxin:NAD+ oxidoreductase RnfC subunit
MIVPAVEVVVEVEVGQEVVEAEVGAVAVHGSINGISYKIIHLFIKLILVSSE